MCPGNTMMHIIYNNEFGRKDVQIYFSLCIKKRAMKFADFLVKNAAVLLICFSLSSCLHEYYSPNSANVPLFKQKGEG
jgi:hypothetical protein